MYITRVIYIFVSNRGSDMLPMHRHNKGTCRKNVLHAWNNISHRAGTLPVIIIIIIITTIIISRILLVDTHYCRLSKVGCFNSVLASKSHTPDPSHYVFILSHIVPLLPRLKRKSGTMERIYSVRKWSDQYWGEGRWSDGSEVAKWPLRHQIGRFCNLPSNVYILWHTFMQK